MPSARSAHLIQLPGWEGVGSTQDLVEVVCPKIVSNERKDGNPDVCFHPEPVR